MAQKINPISFRLGIKNIWRSTWCEDSKKYASLLHKDLETRHCAKLLFQSARVSFNEFASKKNNKFFFIFYKSVHSEIFGLKQIDPIYDLGEFVGLRRVSTG